MIEPTLAIHKKVATPDQCLKVNFGKVGKINCRFFVYDTSDPRRGSWGRWTREAPGPRWWLRQWKSERQGSLRRFSQTTSIGLRRVRFLRLWNSALLNPIDVVCETFARLGWGQEPSSDPGCAIWKRERFATGFERTLWWTNIQGTVPQYLSSHVGRDHPCLIIWHVSTNCSQPAHFWAGSLATHACDVDK